MNQLNQLFDCIHYITLPKRTDRREALEKQLNSLHIKAELWTATYGNPWGYLPNMLVAEAGCLASHYRLLQHLSTLHIKSALVLEDDCVFCDRFDLLFYNFYSRIPDWEMMYLSVNANEPHPTGKRNLKVKPGILRLNYGLTTAAYGVRGSKIPELIGKIEENIRNEKRVKPIDVVYAEHHPNLKAYAASPNLITQAPGYSDVQGCWTDYSSMVK